MRRELLLHACAPVSISKGFDTVQFWV
ncbi:hypothetical protein P9617_gp03 [Escherichia phage SECphi18]|nr:hypothetical protein P9617_gp03 [Escherichia phage SECphi18]